jgi:hypothetical protein
MAAASSWKDAAFAGEPRAAPRQKTGEEKGVVHMIASCATDIMYSNVQLSVKVLGENKISRIFPGIEAWS